MLIKTLGTSHGDPTTIRFNSSTLYEITGNMYLIDCGEPCDALLIRSGRSPWEVKAVFLTHMHDDHISGLSALCKEKYKYNTRLNEDTSLKVMMTEQEAIVPFKAFLEALHIRHTGGDVEFDYIKPNTITYDDGIIKVTSHRTNHVNHGQFPSFSFVIEGEGKKILHTGDLESDFSDFPKIALEDEFDACVCELTHYDFEKALPTFKKCRFKKLIFSHIGNKWHIEENVNLLNELCKQLPYPAILAYDGDEFHI